MLVDVLLRAHYTVFLFLLRMRNLTTLFLLIFAVILGTFFLLQWARPVLHTSLLYSQIFIVKFDMAVARLAAAVSIKQEPPDSPPPTTSRSFGDPNLAAAESHTHPVEPRPVHPVELDERILNLCSENPKGITDDIITADQPQINTEQRLKALQRLLSQACVCVCLSVCIIYNCVWYIICMFAI